MLDGGNFCPGMARLGLLFYGGSIDYRLVGSCCVYEPFVNMNNLDMIPYQHLSYDSWPLCFLTPYLDPINIYLCSLVIFIWVLTTKVTESCSFKSWFMLGLRMKTAMLGLDLLPPCRWLTFISLYGCQGELGRH
jgi:hypothetical protein